MGKHQTKPQPVIRDLGTPELRQHNRVVVEQDVHHRTRLRIVDQTEIDRLLYQNRIDMDEHCTAEHLMRDLIAAGFVRSSNWSLESSIRADVQSISTSRSDALVKIGMGRRYLHKAVGRKTTDWLVNVCLNAVRVGDEELPKLRECLKHYRDYEEAWHKYEGPRDIPTLIAEIT